MAMFGKSAPKASKAPSILEDKDLPPFKTPMEEAIETAMSAHGYSRERAYWLISAIQIACVLIALNMLVSFYLLATPIPVRFFASSFDSKLIELHPQHTAEQAMRLSGQPSVPPSGNPDSTH